MADSMIDIFPTISNIDVLLATYNGERFLETRIESIRWQRGVNIRIIACDDGLAILSVHIAEYFSETSSAPSVISLRGYGETT